MWEVKGGQCGREDIPFSICVWENMLDLRMLCITVLCMGHLRDAKEH